MTVSLKHKFHSLKGDGTDPTKVQPSNWNDEHDILMATAKVLGRATASAGPVEEIDWTAYGRSVINAADAAALKSLIGFTEADIPISATSRIIGRATAGPGGGEELTLSQVLDMVGSPADGDMLVRSGGVWLRVPKGSTGQVLTQGASVAAWAAPVPGFEEKIDAVVAANQSAMTFTGLGSTYRDHVFYLDAVRPGTDAVQFLMELSSDNGSSWITSGYINNILTFASNGVSAGSALSSAVPLSRTGVVPNTSGYGVTGVLTLSAAAASGNAKTIDYEAGFLRSDSVYDSMQGRSIWASGTVINAVRFRFSSGNVLTGTITHSGKRG